MKFVAETQNSAQQDAIFVSFSVPPFYDFVNSGEEEMFFSFCLV